MDPELRRFASSAIRRAAPRVAAIAKRFAPQLAFVRARLSRHSDVGLGLTLSVLWFIGATWLFAAVAEDVVTGDPLVAVDRLITHWFRRHSAPGVTRWMAFVSDAHAALPISAFCLAFALYLGWRRDWYWLLTLLLVVPGGMSLNLLLKQIFQRARSVLDEPLVGVAGFGFPSGHVTAATLLYGVLAAFLAARTPHPFRRVMLYAAAGLMILSVAITRVYLGAHYFSDVVAAAAWGTAWIALCLVFVGVLKRGDGLLQRAQP